MKTRIEIIHDPCKDDGFGDQSFEWEIWLSEHSDQVVVTRHACVRAYKYKASAENAVETWAARIRQQRKIKATMRVAFLYGDGWIWELWIANSSVLVGKKEGFRYTSEKSAAKAARRWIERLNITVIKETNE